MLSVHLCRHTVTFGGYGFWWLYDFLRVATGGFTDGQGKLFFKIFVFGYDQNIYIRQSYIILFSSWTLFYSCFLLGMPLFSDLNFIPAH